QGFADLLRSQVQALHQSLSAAFADALAELEAQEVWQKTDTATRDRLLTEAGLSTPAPLSISTDEALLATLESSPLSRWRDKIAAVSGRFAQVAVEAARLQEPKVQHIRISSGTLRTEAEVKAWITTQE